MSAEARVSEPDTSNAGNPAPPAPVYAPWTMFKLQYIQQNRPERIPLQIDQAQGKEGAKRVILAKLNEIFKKNSEDLGDFKEFIEYRRSGNKMQLHNI